MAKKKEVVQQEKNPIGRPSKYKPEYCQELIEHMRQGFSFESFAGLTMVNVDTLYEWTKVHQDFSDAKKTGFDLSRLFWEKIGIDNILNTSENFGEGAGSKSQSINSTVYIFNLKNRFPKEWRDRQEIDSNIKQQIEVSTVDVSERVKRIKGIE